jgi:hypothetical protein
MYYLTPSHLDCLAGQGMILAGGAEIDRGRSRALLSRGEALLRNGVHDAPATRSSQRRALHEGAWLALGLGRYDETADVLDHTLPRLDTVDSPRSVQVLSEVARLLRRRSRNARVAELRPRLEAALASPAADTTT